MPPLFVELPDEIVVGLCHSLHLASEHIKHFNVTFWTAQEPEAELAHERWGYVARDYASPRRKPIAKLLRCDVLNQQIIPRQPSHPVPLTANAKKLARGRARTTTD